HPRPAARGHPRGDRAGGAEAPRHARPRARRGADVRHAAGPAAARRGRRSAGAGRAARPRSPGPGGAVGAASARAGRRARAPRLRRARRAGVAQVILILWAAVTLGALLAWPVAYWILVPLGRVKLAAFVARLVVPWLSQDREGRAALAGALALHRRRTIDLGLVVWLEARLARAQPPGGRGAGRLGGGGIAAAGLLGAARGDHDGARALLASAAWLPPVWSPAPAAAVAHEWLAADAASRGDWAFVRALSGPRTAAGTFLAL